MAFWGSVSPAWAQAARSEAIAGREVLIFAPASLPPPGARALVVVLHGGLGNASRIESSRSERALRMDAVAQSNGFVVAYLNGTPASKLFGSDMLAWNAGGGCCGLPFRTDVDDVAYIRGVVSHLLTEYSLDPARIFVMGHSNGAMMAQRLMCSTTLFAAAVAVSGPLNLEDPRCESARGRRILAIHGANDQNVPIPGGRGSKGIAGASYNSEEKTRQVFTDAGALYTLEVLPGVDHNADAIDAALKSAQGVSLAQKAAQFFELTH